MRQTQAYKCLSYACGILHFFASFPLYIATCDHVTLVAIFVAFSQNQILFLVQHHADGSVIFSAAALTNPATNLVCLALSQTSSLLCKTMYTRLVPVYTPAFTDAHSACP